MCLWATVSHSMKGGWKCLLQHLCSKGGYLLSVPGTCAHIPTKKRVWHHWGIMWWSQMSYDDILVTWGFQMMTFMSVLKGYKRKNTWEGDGSKLRFHRVKIYTPLVLRCIPALGLPRISINGNVMCLVSVSPQLWAFKLSSFSFYQFLCLSDHQESVPSS